MPSNSQGQPDGIDDCQEPRSDSGHGQTEPGQSAPSTVPAGGKSKDTTAKRGTVAVDKTIPMILDSYGGHAVELGSLSSSSATSGPKTMKKVLVDDEGIIADEDKYDVKEMLAKGGMGMVLAAEDVNIRRQVAVKVMLPKKEESTDSLLRFVEEAQVTGQLEHPNIVPVHELGVQPSGQVFYTMKMIQGRTLKDVLRKIKKGDEATIKEYPLLRLMTIFMKICDAVAFAHDRKVIHRDLKPENVMIGDFGEVLVVDWGLAKILKQKRDDSITVEDIALHDVPVQSVRSATGSDQHVTMDGKVMGTPRYMAPEQVAGINSKMDCRVDVYSLGAILYAILTLRSHIDGKDVNEVLRKTMIGAHVPLDVREKTHDLPHCPNGRLPTGLKAIAEKCLKLHPVDRYQDVQDLQRDVEAWQQGYATEAENATLVRQLALLVGRHKPVFSVAGAALLVLAIMGVVSFNKVVKERNVAEGARQQEEIARGIAETAREKTAVALRLEEKARQQAVDERMLAIQAKERERVAKEQERAARKKAEWENYCNTIHLVKTRIDEGSFDLAQSLLWGLPQDLRNWEWGYLLEQSSPELISLEHRGSVFTAQFSPDGTRIACGGDRGTITIWDVATKSKLRSWKAHQYRAQSIAFSPDGTRILTNGNGTTAIVWDVASGKKLLTLSVQGKVSISAGAFTPDGRRMITVTSPHAYGSNGEREDELTPLYGGTFKVPRKFSFPGWESFSQGGDQVVLQESSEAVQVWDAATGEHLSNELKGQPALLAALFPDSKNLAILNNENPRIVLIWNFKTSTVSCRLEGHRDRVRSVVFSKDGSRVLTASDDKTAILWDANTGQVLATYGGHSDSLCSAAFSPDGRRVVTTACDNSAKIWDAGGGDTGMVLAIDDYAIDGEFSSDGTRIVTAGSEVRVWDAKTGRQLLVHKGKNTSFSSAQFSPDGAWILGVTFGKAHVLDAKTGKERLVLKDPDGWIQFATFSPDGAQIVTAGSKVRVRFWDATDGGLLNVWNVGEMAVRTVAFSLDGNFIVSTGGLANDKPQIREVATGLRNTLLNSVQSGFISATFSHNGERVVASAYKVARVWDARSGNELTAFKGHGDLIDNAAFSPDGSRVVTACRDNTARIWDVQTGRELLSLKDFKGDVHSARFSPDGMRLLVTSGKDAPRVLEAFDWRLDKEAFDKLKLNAYKTSIKWALPKK